MKQEEKAIEIPFGAKDSELLEWVYFIPEGMEAEIKDRKVIIKNAESEDERIRMALIKLMTVAGESYVMSATGFKKERLLAYLEKQKEPLTPEEKMNHPLYLEGFDVGREVGHVEAEQKSAEIDFGDWDTLGYIRDIVREHVIRDEEFNMLDKWLIEHYVEQKPAGWSEEDEKWFDYFERLLEFGYNKDPHYLGKLCIGGKMWLRSLRRSWKPSEEQIEALRRALRINPVSGKLYYLKEDEVCILQSLLRELEKL